MQNALFDDLKDLKKDLALNEKKENEKKEEELRMEKEVKIKDSFENFMKDAGIKKID